MNSEIHGLWKSCQIEIYGHGGSVSRNARADEGSKNGISGFWKVAKSKKVEGQGMFDLITDLKASMIKFRAL